MPEKINAQDQFLDNLNIERNDLEVDIETWDDPGDYPSGAGSGPLDSYSYPVLSGSLKFTTWIDESSDESGEVSEDIMTDHIVATLTEDYIPSPECDWDKQKFKARMIEKEVTHKNGKYFFKIEVEFDE